MKQFFVGLLVALSGIGLAAADAQAKRLGGGGSSGLQRHMPAKPMPSSPPAQQAAPTPPGGAPTAAPAGRSWLAPMAGLAAGLGLAALVSQLGLGEEFASVIMLALLALVAVAAVRWVMRRLGPPVAQPRLQPEFRFAGAGMPQGGTAPSFEAAPASAAAGAAPASALPPGFDSAAFERVAKLIFIRMQAANDKADLEDLRQFATPEMFAVFKLDLQDRGGRTQQTDVVQLAAEVVDFTQEAARQIVSVRFRGLIREEKDGVAQPFDEVWHLVKPMDASREWAIAGITQVV